MLTCSKPALRAHATVASAGDARLVSLFLFLHAEVCCTSVELKCVELECVACSMLSPLAKGFFRSVKLKCVATLVLLN